MSRSGQRDLFGWADEGPGAAAVRPAPVPEDLAAVARQLPPGIRLGTSSWSFPGWEGIVYDRCAPAGVLSRDGLRAYSAHPLLRAVGIDRTFYAPIAATDFRAYSQQVPEDFRFLVKAPSLCTAPRILDRGIYGAPNPHYLDPAFASDAAVAPFAEGLGRSAGPLVFQFPPQGRAIVRDPRMFASRLGEFLDALPRGPRYAVEVRDRELLCAAYFEALDHGRAAHCLTLHPRMPAPAEQWRMASATAEDLPVVVRWMLRPDLGYGEARLRYQPFSRLVDEDLPSRSFLAALCAQWASRGRDVFVIANNKAEGSAPLTVFRLAEAIAGIREGEAGSPP